MKLTKAQYTLVKGALPRQRETISMSNLQVLNTIVHIAEIAVNGEHCWSILTTGIPSMCT